MNKFPEIGSIVKVTGGQHHNLKPDTYGIVTGYFCGLVRVVGQGKDGDPALIQYLEETKDFVRCEVKEKVHYPEFKTNTFARVTGGLGQHGFNLGTQVRVIMEAFASRNGFRSYWVEGVDKTGKTVTVVLPSRCLNGRLASPKLKEIDAKVKAPSSPAALTPQAKRVLEYLLAGKKLTKLSALFELNVQSITKRISELRDAGIEITTTMLQDHRGVKYGSYSMKAAEIARVKAWRSRETFGIYN